MPNQPQPADFSAFTKIKGLSETIRMPRLGKIRLGAKVLKKGSGGGTEYPVELPFFLLTDEVAKVHGGSTAHSGDTAHDGNALVERAKELGVTRKDVLDFIKDNAHRLAETLPVMIPVEDETKAFPQAYKMYGSSIGLKCIGNGEAAQKRVGESKTWENVECPCSNMKTDENPKGACSRVAHLQVMLPMVSAGGVYQIDIGSINSIIDINSSIVYIRTLLGRVAMVPLVLRRVPTETHHGGKKQIHYTCKVEIAYTLSEINSIRANPNTILTHDAVYQLEAPALDDPKAAPVDAVIEQSAEMKETLATLKKWALDKKLLKTEVEQIKIVADSNDDTALAELYAMIKARVQKGTSSADVRAELENKSAPIDDTPAGKDAERAGQAGGQGDAAF